MGDKEHNIHDFDIALICEYFSSMDRQGPGSQGSTLKALSFIDNPDISRGLFRRIAGYLLGECPANLTRIQASDAWSHFIHNSVGS